MATGTINGTFNQFYLIKMYQAIKIGFLSTKCWALGVITKENCLNIYDRIQA